MKTYVCSVCGYLYEEEKGVPGSSIAPGTLWQDLPADWVCPLCGASKSAFRKKDAQTVPVRGADVDVPKPERELSAIEMSILCSNLARGCEKQYLAEESQQFSLLAERFCSRAEKAPAPDFAALQKLIDRDLSEGYPYANLIAGEKQDRGALRALVWSEKVTNMLHSLLERYAREGEAMLLHTGVYVCTICGFVFVGDAPPEICPVCKVPSWKFEKMEGRGK